MLCRGWCGKCYANARGRENNKGHRGYHVPSNYYLGRWDVAKWLQRHSGSGPAAAVLNEDTAFAKGCPALWEFLTVTLWEDGAERKPGTLYLFVDNGRWKVMLKDVDAGRVAFFGAETWAALLKGLEAGLQASSLDWRVDRKPTGRRQ